MNDWLQIGAAPYLLDIACICSIADEPGFEFTHEAVHERKGLVAPEWADLKISQKPGKEPPAQQLNDLGRVAL